MSQSHLGHEVTEETKQKIRQANSGERSSLYKDGRTRNYPYYLYRTWLGMKERCEKSYRCDYHRYGGRGIKVCEEWSNNPIAFMEYMLEQHGERPKGYSIDRIDVNGHYEPGNVRWASKQEQARNRRPRRKAARQ